MLVNCPHCAKQLKLSDKIRDSIKTLDANRKIKVKCVQCGAPFGLDKSMVPSGAGGAVAPKAGGARKKGTVRPPAPPNLDWLRDGTFEDKEVIEDIPRALLLFGDDAAGEAVGKAVQSIGYRVEEARSAEEGIEMMRFVNYAAVFLHAGFEPGGIASGIFHAHMRAMPMQRRRFVFYVLLGAHFTTLYDLEALANSANLVINESEIPHIGLVLRKAIPEYETLFGPLMEELRIAGK